jgi:TctA family transporter
VLGPRLEENFRRALLLSRGSLETFIDRPISAFFVAACVLLLVAQAVAAWRRMKPPIRVPEAAFD